MVTFEQLLGRYGEDHPDGMYDDREYGARVCFEDGRITWFRDRDELDVPWAAAAWKADWGTYPDTMKEVQA